MDTESVIQIIALILLLFLSAFFSSAETALTTVSRVRVRSLAEEGNKKAVKLLKVLDKHSKMLSAILIGNNIVNISASALATVFTTRIWGNYAVGIATGILTFVVLLFGEIVPKTMASVYSDHFSLSYANVVYFLMTLLTPLIFIIDKIAHFIFFICHLDTYDDSNTFTENELKTIVDVSHEDGVIESEERELIYNVFDFGDTCAKDVMIPRIDMTSINVTASYQELFEVFKNSMYTRIPVYEDTPDNIIGIVNVKDFLLVTTKRNFSIRSILRDTYYTYEYKKTADLLIEMREKAINMTMVLNEYGATEGLITLEDLLEEIVGEIRDEYDEDENDFIKPIDEKQFLIDGSMKLDDINNALGTDLDSEDYDSIGGIIIEKLDRLPEVNEEISLDNNILLRVINVSQNRIEKVLMILPETEENEETL